jgi:regulator of RNase E activity RraA
VSAHLVHPRVQGVTPELLDRYRDISAATIGHFTESGFVRGLSALFRPIRLVGNAVTVRISHLDGSVIRQALLLSQPHDVLVIDMSGDDERACWGELRTRAALIKGLAGVVVAGCVTDSRIVMQLGLPVFCRGISALTTRSLDTSGEVNTPVTVGGVSVEPGDLVVGDDDGLFILNPRRAWELAGLCQEKLEAEQRQRDRFSVRSRGERAD